MTQENPVPLIGSRISLLSNKDVRYEGVLLSVNLLEQSLALQNVKSFGTEGRAPSLALEVAASAMPMDCLVFNSRDIKNLHVHQHRQPEAEPSWSAGASYQHHQSNLVKLTPKDLQTIKVEDLLASNKDSGQEHEQQTQSAGETRQTESEARQAEAEERSGNSISGDQYLPFRLDHELQMGHPAVQATLFFLDSPSVDQLAQRQVEGVGMPASSLPKEFGRAQLWDQSVKAVSLEASEGLHQHSQQPAAQKASSFSPLLTTKATDACWATQPSPASLPASLGRDASPLSLMAASAREREGRENNGESSSAAQQQQQGQLGLGNGASSLFQALPPPAKEFPSISEDTLFQVHSSLFLREVQSGELSRTSNSLSSSLPPPSTLLQTMAPGHSSSQPQPVVARSASSGNLSAALDQLTGSDRGIASFRERQLHELLPSHFRPQTQQQQEEASLLRQQMQRAQAQSNAQQEMDFLHESTQRFAMEGGIQSAASTPGLNPAMSSRPIPNMHLLDPKGASSSSQQQQQVVSSLNGALPSSVHMEIEEKRIRAISLGGISDYQATREAMLRAGVGGSDPSGFPAGSPDFPATRQGRGNGYMGPNPGRGRGFRGRGRAFEGRGGRGGRWHEEWGGRGPPDGFFRNGPSGPREAFRGGRGGGRFNGRGNMGPPPPHDSEGDWGRGEEWYGPMGGPPHGYFERDVPLRHRNRGGAGYHGHHNHGPPPSWFHDGPLRHGPHPGRGEFRGEFEGRPMGGRGEMPYWEDPHWHHHGPRGPGRGGRFDNGRGPRGYPSHARGPGRGVNGAFLGDSPPPPPHNHHSPPRQQAQQQAAAAAQQKQQQAQQQANSVGNSPASMSPPASSQGGASFQEMRFQRSEYYSASGDHYQPQEMMDPTGTSMMDPTHLDFDSSGQTPRGRAAAAAAQVEEQVQQQAQAQYQAALHQFDQLKLTTESQQSLSYHALGSAASSRLAPHQSSISENILTDTLVGDPVSQEEASERLRTSVDQYFGGTNIKW